MDFFSFLRFPYHGVKRVRLGKHTEVLLSPELKRQLEEEHRRQLKGRLRWAWTKLLGMFGR